MHSVAMITLLTFVVRADGKNMATETADNASERLISKLDQVQYSLERSVDKLVDNLLATFFTWTSSASAAHDADLHGTILGKICHYPWVVRSVPPFCASPSSLATLRAQQQSVLSVPAWPRVNYEPPSYREAPLDRHVQVIVRAERQKVNDVESQEAVKAPRRITRGMRGFSVKRQLRIVNRVKSILEEDTNMPKLKRSSFRHNKEDVIAKKEQRIAEEIDMGNTTGSDSSSPVSVASILIVDGYNLCGCRSDSMPGLYEYFQTGAVEMAQATLISALGSYSSSSPYSRIICVFDSSANVGDTRLNGIEVVYTPDADDWIRNTVIAMAGDDGEYRSIYVASNDNDIKGTIQTVGAYDIRSDALLSQIGAARRQHIRKKEPPPRTFGLLETLDASTWSEIDAIRRGPSANTAAQSKAKKEFRDLLRKYSIGHCQDKLKKLGINVIEDLHLVEEEDLDEIGFRAADKRDFGEMMEDDEVQKSSEAEKASGKLSPFQLKIEAMRRGLLESNRAKQISGSKDHSTGSVRFGTPGSAAASEFYTLHGWKRDAEMDFKATYGPKPGRVPKSAIEFARSTGSQGGEKEPDKAKLFQPRRPASTIGSIKITLQTVEGDSFQVDANPRDTISDLKKKIAEAKPEYLAVSQTLKYYGDTLGDNVTIANSGYQTSKYMDIRGEALPERQTRIKRMSKRAAQGGARTKTAYTGEINPEWHAHGNGSSKKVAETAAAREYLRRFIGVFDQGDQYKLMLHNWARVRSATPVYNTERILQVGRKPAFSSTVVLQMDKIESVENEVKREQEEPLPGGVMVGDIVFSTIDFTRKNGEVLSKGDRGVVKGPSKSKIDNGQRVEISFETMKKVNLMPEQFNKDALADSKSNPVSFAPRLQPKLTEAKDVQESPGGKDKIDKIEAILRSLEAKAEEKTSIKTKEEAKGQARTGQTEAKEDAKKTADEYAKGKAEEEAQAKAEKARIKADEEANTTAEQEAQVNAEEEAKKARMKADEEARQTQREAQAKTEEATKKAAEEKVQEEPQPKAEKTDDGIWQRLKDAFINR